MFALLHWAADAKDVAFGAATISDDVNLAKKEWTGGNLYVKGDEVILFVDKWLKYVNRTCDRVSMACTPSTHSIRTPPKRFKAKSFNCFLSSVAAYDFGVSRINDLNKRMTWSKEEISCTFTNIIRELCCNLHYFMIVNLMSFYLRGKVVLVYITVICR